MAGRMPLRSVPRPIGTVNAGPQALSHGLEVLATLRSNRHQSAPSKAATNFDLCAAGGMMSLPKPGGTSLPAIVADRAGGPGPLGRRRDPPIPARHQPRPFLPLPLGTVRHGRVVVLSPSADDGLRHSRRQADESPETRSPRAVSKQPDARPGVTALWEVVAGWQCADATG